MYHIKFLKIDEEKLKKILKICLVVIAIFLNNHPPSTHIFLFHQIENLREKKFATTSFRLPIHPRTGEKWSHPGSLSRGIIGVTGMACILINTYLSLQKDSSLFIDFHKKTCLEEYTYMHTHT